MQLPPPFIRETDLIHVIVESPQGSRNKYTFQEASGMYKLSKVFPAGMVFPYEFGFIPNTKAEDGDPVDVLLFTDGPTYPGCLVEARVVGIIEGEDSENGKTNRNDRVLAVAVESLIYASINTIDDLNNDLLDDVSVFFEAYHKRSHTEFHVLGISGPGKALALIKEGIQ